jgi:Cyclic nucleotide-binding domain/Major Facilitator Superfamily
MDGGAGRQRIGGRLASTLGALAVDFGNRDLGLLGVARVGISYASWCLAIALGVYGFEVGGAVAVGVVALVRLLPGALASPFAGLLGDRFPRRDVLIGSGLVVTVVLAATSVAAAMDSDAWVVAVFAGVFTAAISGYVPAEAALLPALARSPQELSAANVTHSAMDNVGFLGAALTTGLVLHSAGPATVFGVAAAVALVTTAGLTLIARDERPAYAADGEISGLWRQSVLGFRTLLSDSGLRLLGALLVVVVFFEGTAEVLVVILALDLLHLDHGSVGYLNAAWGIGALLGGATLSVMLGRGRLAIGLAVGSAVVALATALPALWTVAVAAYVGWLAIGLGYTVAEVAAKTLLQRLGSDETLSRVIGSLESARLAAMALGSISASVFFELLGIQGALLLLAALLPAVVALSWARLRAFEVGAPVAEEQFQLLRGNSIFSPLPVATLERLSNNLVAVQAPAGEEVITQGDPGDRFYLIEEGEVEVFEDGVFRRNEGRGECFGEIALLRDVPRTATVRTTKRTTLLALEREQFITAVTGHQRSHQVAHTVVDDRWAPETS